MNHSVNTIRQRQATLFLCLLLLSFFFAGFVFAEDKPKKEKAPPSQLKTIAILPVQKNLPFPIYLSTHPSFFNVVKRAFRDKRFSLEKRLEYDPEFVLKTLNFNLTKKVLGHEYLVFTPDQVEPFFKDLALFHEEFNIEDLNRNLNADAILMVTLSEWDSEKFDDDGKFKVGFQAVLIDAASKKAVWSNQASGMQIKTSSSDFLYYKYEREVLQELTDKIMKGFPSKDWAVS